MNLARPRLLVAGLVVGAVSLAMLSLLAETTCACTPIVPDTGNRTPTLGSTFRHVAAVQESVYTASGGYIGTTAQFAHLPLPVDVQIAAATGDAAAYTVRVDSGRPPAVSCLVTGKRGADGSAMPFTLDCRPRAVR